MDANDNNIPLMINVSLFSILCVGLLLVLLLSFPSVGLEDVLIKVPVLAPMRTYNSINGNAAILAIMKCDNFKLVVPHMYETGPNGNMGVKYNMAMMRNPCSVAAISIASKMGYFRIHFLTTSRII